MKRKFILMLALCLMLAAAIPALAQVSANYDLSWRVTAGGGGRSVGTSYTLIGTIGQPLTGQMFDGDQTLCSGFWCGGESGGYHIYLPLLLRNH